MTANEYTPVTLPASKILRDQVGRMAPDTFAYVANDAFWCDEHRHVYVRSTADVFTLEDLDYSDRGYVMIHRLNGKAVRADLDSLPDMWPWGKISNEASFWPVAGRIQYADPENDPVPLGEQAALAYEREHPDAV